MSTRPAARFPRFLVLALLVGLAYGPFVTTTNAALAAPAHASGGELVQVGQDESIVLSVNAETVADMVSVDILVPPGYLVNPNRPPDAKGGGVGGVFITWSAHVSGSGSGARIEAAGPGVANGGILLVTFWGTASRVGTLSFVTVTHAADGTTVRWDGSQTSPHPAALVFVVASLSSPQTTPGAASGETPTTLPPWWAIALAGAGGLALVGGVVTGRRRGGSRRPGSPPRQSSGRLPGKVSNRRSGARR